MNGRKSKTLSKKQPIMKQKTLVKAICGMLKKKGIFIAVVNKNAYSPRTLENEMIKSFLFKFLIC